MTTVSYKFALRRDTAFNWVSKNPILLSGEPGVEELGIGLGARLKIGDGVTVWTSLSYVTGSGGGGGNTILSGTTPPTGGQGNIGDLYYETTNSTLFGPKTTGGWGSGVTLVGPPGSPGSNGTNAVWTQITQAAYNALSPPVSGTLYVVVG